MTKMPKEYVVEHEEWFIEDYDESGTVARFTTCPWREDALRFTEQEANRVAENIGGEPVYVGHE